MNANAKLATARKLVAAQPNDGPWLIEAAQLLSLEPDLLMKEDWASTAWPSTWGSLEVIINEEVRVLIWHRPDGAGPAADTTPESIVSLNLKAVRFALLAEIASILPNLKQLSYAEVGHPHNWKSCEIWVGEKRVDGVVKADALLGTCTVYLKERGKFVTSLDNKEFVTTDLKGDVRILVNDNQHPFF